MMTSIKYSLVGCKVRAMSHAAAANTDSLLAPDAHAHTPLDPTSTSSSLFGDHDFEAVPVRALAATSIGGTVLV